MSRPLLFLDVDGPLNPYAAARPAPLPGYRARPVPTTLAARPWRLWLNPAHGPALLRQGFDICWATAWMSEANRHIGPVLGLPELPFVDFGDDLFGERADGVHWKTAAIVEHAAGRPFLWVDDETTILDDLYVAAWSPAPAALHHVDPRVGLRLEDFLALGDLAAGLDGRHGRIGAHDRDRTELAGLRAGG
ncbi:HAD domain-containing protein [Streptomyces abyssomicinicus]|uniref:HAD domain-containing protein n=1 Tax=Streptomyces abyssomicinicus TaxID=574929 RepID=UPI001FEC1908|nr:HAD domain-containing protein [Streptomyces abyssomicinicus]